MIKSQRIEKILPEAASLLFFAAMMLFFGLSQPYHIHYREQYQLFQWSWDYFRAVASCPGGLADWLSRALVQFFYYAWAGAAIIAAILTAIRMLLRRLCDNGWTFLRSFTFIPPLIIAFGLGDENLMLDAPVGLLLSLGLLLCFKNRSGRTSEVAGEILIPLLYMAAGPVSAVYAFGLAISAIYRKSPVSAVADIVLMALCPIAAHYIFPYPLQRLVQGIHYHRYPLLPALWPWIAAAASLILIAVANIRVKRQGPLWHSLLGLLVIVPLAAQLPKSIDKDKEESMKYDFMVRMRQWNKIMMCADRDMPSKPMTVSCLNLALAMSGRITDHQFEYFQNGPDGLFPTFTKDFTSPLPTSEIFYHLGMINSSRHYTYEVQEAIPDFQKSARCHKRLAECCLIDGEYKLAAKYLKPLTRTIFYRSWALNALNLLGDEEAINAHPEYGPARQKRISGNDFFFSDTEMDSMLGLLYVHNNDNTLAYTMMSSYVLLSKNLDRFVEVFPIKHWERIPDVYQQALMLWWSRDHSDFNDYPWPCSRQAVEALAKFLRMTQNGSNEAVVKREFGRSYWYYYFYRYR